MPRKSLYLSKLSRYDLHGTSPKSTCRRHIKENNRNNKSNVESTPISQERRFIDRVEARLTKKKSKEIFRGTATGSGFGGRLLHTKVGPDQTTIAHQPHYHGTTRTRKHASPSYLIPFLHEIGRPLGGYFASFHCYPQNYAHSPVTIMRHVINHLPSHPMQPTPKHPLILKMGTA